MITYSSESLDQVTNRVNWSQSVENSDSVVEVAPGRTLTKEMLTGQELTCSNSNVTSAPEALDAIRARGKPA
jgi:hypothetical protein